MIAGIRLNLERTRPAQAAVLATLCVLVLVTLSSSLLGSKVFTSGDSIFLWPPFSAQRPAHWVRPANSILTDPLVGFNPDLLQTRADISSGVLPLWNPDAGAGHPLLASQVHAPLFPLTWLAFLLPFWSSLAWIAAGKLLLAAAGTYLFCRELGLRRGPALLGAMAFAFGTYFFAWLEHPQTNVWAMLPWMLFATRRLCTTGSLGAAALLGVSGGLAWLGGHPESGAFLLAATIAYGAFELIAERRAGPSPGAQNRSWSGPGWSEPIRVRAGLIALALLLGLGIGAIVNLPLIELLRQSGKTQRGGPPIPFQEGWAFFFPELWGNPSKAFTAVGPSNWAERTAYIGVLPLLLAAGSIGRRRPREQWFFVAVAVILLATIFDTPLWASGIRKLPEANVARLERLLILVTFAGAVLAAMGLQRWITGTRPERRRMLWMMGSAALIPPLLWLPRHLSLMSSLGTALGQLPAVHGGETSPTVFALSAVWRWVFIGALGLLILGLTGRRRSPRLTVVLIVALTGGDLVVLARGFHGSIPRAQANPPVPTVIRYLQEHQGEQRVTASAALPANLGERYGLRDPRIAIDIPYPTRYAKLWGALGGIGGDQEYFVAQEPRAHRLADIFATSYVLLSPTEQVPAWLHPVLRTAAGTVGFNATALPRAWVAYDWRQSYGQPSSLGQVVASTTTELRNQPVIEGSPAPPAGSPPRATGAIISKDRSESVTVEADAARPGYLVLDDSAYPGWTASLDGHAARWLPANENFRAVAIPAGRHTVSFHYRPASARWGAILTALSLIALAVLAAAAAMTYRRRRARP